MKKLIEVKNLKVSFKNKKKIINIIRGVNISLYEGQILGIVGESGSGKSVTSKALLNVNSGAITKIDSIDILGNKETKYKKMNWKKLRGHDISYIPQNPQTSLNPSRKIYKQILDVIEQSKGKYFNVDKGVKLTKEVKLTKISELLKTFKITNIKGVLNSFPHELSGGLKQRVIIAMSILTGAKVIIADEPTTALDATVQSSVLKMLKDVIVEQKLAMIFISHNIGVVAKLCDYIYVMYAGKVIEKAPKTELLTNPVHPYTWALISSIPEGLDKELGKLYTIEGSPPDMANLSVGDPFAPRNKYAIEIDFKQEPPLFEVKKGHLAATWMLHPSYPKFEKPKELLKKIEAFKRSLK